MKLTGTLILTICVFGVVESAIATPSTQVWIPSTDIQTFGTFHFGLDTYGNVGLKSGANSGRGFNVMNYGLTAGLLPPTVSKMIGVEAGVDFRDVSGDTYYPIYLNTKVGIPEDAFGLALAVGGYDFGTKKDVTDYNIFYGLVSRTFEQIGRFSFGGFTGNDRLMTDESGNDNASGLLASWDKVLSDRWWAAIDFMSGGSLHSGQSQQLHTRGRYL
jgi:hypothetical protein